MKGEITDPTMEENYLRSIVLKKAKQKVFLCNAKKIGKQSTFKLCNLNEINYAVFDTEDIKIETKCEIL